MGATAVETRERVGRAWGPGVPEHPVVLRPPARETLLAEELCRVGGDPVFERALAAA